MTDARDLDRWADERIRRRNESLAKLEAAMGGPPEPEALMWAQGRFQAEREAMAAAAARAEVSP